MKFSVLSLVAFLVVLAKGIEAYAPNVTLPDCANHTVVGYWDEDSPNGSLATFLSIPFALPPKRWQPPQRSECPSVPTITQQTHYGPICYQFNAFNFDVRPPRAQSEDCLQLDIYTNHPSDPDAKKPVLFWIHGGSLVLGSSTFYPGVENFAMLSDVVMVVIQYRLGTFGYLATSALSAADPRGVSGNYGLLDQLEALEWVQRNIAAFGGDPEQVTLMGQSSGGTAIFQLMMTPLAAQKKLFRAGISLSGSPNITIDLAQAEKQNEDVLSSSACGGVTDQVGCLMGLSGEEVASLWPDSFSVTPFLPVSYTEGQQYPGLPIVDGVTIPYAIEEAFSRKIVDVPLLVQSMVAEMDTFSNADDKPIYAMDTQSYSDFLETSMEEGGWPTGSGEGVASLYSEELAQSTELGYQQYKAEYSFTCPNIELMKSLRNFSSPVYLSLVERHQSHPLHTIPATPPSLYAGHMWDYIAGFQSWNYFFLVAQQPRVYQPDENDKLQSELLFSQWNELVQTGKISSFVSNSDSNNNGGVVTMLQTSDSSGKPIVVPQSNAFADRCDTLKKDYGLDQRFWCTN